MERTPPRPISAERLAWLARILDRGRAPCFHKPLFEPVAQFGCSVDSVLSVKLGGGQDDKACYAAPKLRFSTTADVPQLAVYVPAQVRYLNKAPRMETAFGGMQHMLFASLMERLQSFLAENFDRLSSRRLDTSLPVEQRDTQTLRFYEMVFVGGVYPVAEHTRLQVAHNAAAPPTHCVHVWVIVIPPPELKLPKLPGDAYDSEDEDAMPRYPGGIINEIKDIREYMYQWFKKELCQMPLFNQIPLGVQ